MVAQTLVSLPTPALIDTPSFTPIPRPSQLSGTPPPSVTPTATLTATAGTARTPTSASPSPSSVPFSIDTLPANTRYGTIRLENRSKTGVSVSLHCTTHQGYQTVLEYDVYRTTIVEAPLGDYVYVVYIGGHKYVGSFSYGQPSPLTITFYRDKVVIH
jgi:hypothetical protein